MEENVSNKYKAYRKKQPDIVGLFGRESRPEPQWNLF